MWLNSANSVASNTELNFQSDRPGAKRLKQLDPHRFLANVKKSRSCLTDVSLRLRLIFYEENALKCRLEACCNALSFCIISYLSIEEREGWNAILASVWDKIGPDEDCLWMILKGLKNVSCSTNKVAAYYVKDYSRSIFFSGCPITSQRLYWFSKTMKRRPSWCTKPSGSWVLFLCEKSLLF